MATQPADTDRPAGSRIRIVDVADASGFSPSVVSRVLSGKGEVTAATRRQILAAAEELGYERNVENRGRPRTHGHLVDLTLAYFDSAWAAEVIAGAWDVAGPLGLDLLLTTERDRPDADWVQRTQARGASGAIVGSIRPTARELRYLARAGIPVVLLDPRSDGPGAVPSVGTSDRQGGFDAGVHLAERAAERFIGVVGTPKYRFGRERMEGFAEGVAKLIPGAAVDILSVAWSPRGAATKALVPILKKSTGPVGIFAVNDAMAKDAYTAAEITGLSIPDDVRVIGFDDEPTSRLLSPPLTTVQYPLREAAQEAVKLISAALRGRTVPTERIELPSRLIVRGSTVPGADR